MKPETKVQYWVYDLFFYPVCPQENGRLYPVKIDISSSPVQTICWLRNPTGLTFARGLYRQ